MNYYSRGLASFFEKMRPITSIALALVMIIQAFGPGAFALQADATVFCSGAVFSSRFDRTQGQSEFQNWTSSNGNWFNSSSSDDAYVQGDTNGSDYLTKAVSTVGKENLVLTFTYKADDLESGDVVDLQWTTNGSTWTTVSQNPYPPITNGDESNNWKTATVNLPAGASDASGFQFRFKAVLSGNSDKVWIDDVCLKGTDIPKINICHATNSQNNPWDAIPINQSAWSTHEGHGDFLYAGPVKQNGQPNDAQNQDDAWCLQNSKGTLIVKKIVAGPPMEGAHANAFSFQIDNGTPIQFQNDNSLFKGKNEITLSPGTYDVTEVLLPHFTPSYEGCSDVVITPGSTKTCTITNTYVPTPPPTPTTAKISATKIVCNTEDLLPDWATGGPDVTGTTASEFLASTPERAAGCRVVPDWKFQWAPESATDAGGSYIGSALAPWVTFGPTDANGIATVDVPLQNVGSKIWVREELKNGFLGFSFDGDNDNTESAEIYCDRDVLNYDNYDFIQSPVAGNTYHCVAFNVRVQPPITNTCITPNSLNDKSAFTLGVSPEPQLVNIFADHAINLDPLIDQINTQVWDLDPTSVSTTLEIELLAKHAGNNQVFGYYKDGNASSFTPVFRVGTHSNPSFASLPELSLNGTTTVTIPAPAAHIGFALDTDGTSSARYYSQTSLNGDGKDHVAVYNAASNTYVVAFEDLPGTSWDKDHNDLVVRIQNITCEKCAPQEGMVVSGTNTQVTSVKIGENAPVLGNNPAVEVTPTTITDGYWSADDDALTFGSAKWVWSEDPVQDWTVDKVVTFEETFNVTGTATGAQLVVAADNSYEAFVNGVKVGEVATDNGHVAPAETYAVTLNPGVNTLKIVVKNWAQAGDALNNPGGLIYKLTWSVQCGEGPTDPKKAKVFVKKYIGETAAENAQLSEGVDFNLDTVGAPTGNVILNSANSFSWTSNEVAVAQTQVTVAERTTATVPVDSDVLPIDAQCVSGKYKLAGYRESAISFEDAKTQSLQVTPSWTKNIQGNTYVIVENTFCAPPQVAGVTVCKVDESQNSLSGWTMVLLGNKVQDDLAVDTSVIAGVDSVALIGGKSYVAHATGSWTNQGGNNPADAEYSQLNGVGPWVDQYPGFVSDILELRIANQFGNWGAYNSTHSYWRAFVPSLNGAVSFGIFDGENDVQNASWFGDNSGSINVDIYEGYAGVTGQDGCVTFTDVPYGTYVLDEQLQDGWTKVSGTGSVTIDSVTESFTVVNTDETVCTGNCGGSGETQTFATTTIKTANLATSFGDVAGDVTKWFFFNDENNTIDNSIGALVVGPNPNILGDGSSEMSVTGTQRRNIATYQFKDVKLSDITTLRFSTYSQGSSVSERSAYLHFNVDFNNTDTWQRRLVYLPSENGAVVNGVWQTWDAIDSGNAKWTWSGYEGNGNTWPDGNPNRYRTWNEIKTAFPNAQTRSTDSFLGFRVGEPYADGFTGNVDYVIMGIKAGTNTHTHAYDFEPTVTPPTITTTSTGGGGGNWAPYFAGLVAGASDAAPEVLGATDELPLLPNTGNGPVKTTGSEAVFVYGTILLALIFGNTVLLRARR